MNIKNVLICLLIIAVLLPCSLNSVGAASVNKFTPDIHGNYTAGVGEKQQTYLVAFLRNNQTAVTMRVNRSIWLCGVLSSGTPPASANDTSHGIPNATVNIQSMNPDGKTWTTIRSEKTLPDTGQRGFNYSGRFITILTPVVAGVYTYRVTYDGDRQYAPAFSNVVTLNVTNVVIS